MTDASNGSRKSRLRPPAAKKACASRKTLRHGLAAISHHSPTLFPEIERMATAICNGDADPLLFEQALVIAENELILRCVRVERVAVIERLRDVGARPLSKRDNSLTRAKARFRAAKLEYKRLVQARKKKVPINNRQERDLRKEQESEAVAKKQEPIKSRDEFEAMRLAMPDLDRLARYERRAWSRRKRAIRDFMEVKSRSAIRTSE